MLMTCVALTALVAVIAVAQDSTAPAKDAITDMTVINLCGGRLALMFAQCGLPLDLVAIRADTADKDDVVCDYGTYMFRVRNKKVRICFFRDTWQGPIRGIKSGDSREDVVKALGDPAMTFKDKDGVITAYGYHLKDLGVDFYPNFDQNGKTNKVEIDPMQ
jgi:hypothetical protein